MSDHVLTVLPWSQIFLSWSLVRHFAQSLSLLTTTDSASVATPSSRYSMFLALQATPSPASSVLIGREASFMSVSPLQNFLNPPPVPAKATVTLTPVLAFWKSSATARVI